MIQGKRKRFKIERTEEELTSYGGLTISGQYMEATGV